MMLPVMLLVMTNISPGHLLVLLTLILFLLKSHNLLVSIDRVEGEGDKLDLLHLNVCGLIAQHEELEVTICSLGFLKILGLCETCSSPHYESLCSYPGYNIIPCFRN